MLSAQRYQTERLPDDLIFPTSANEYRDLVKQVCIATSTDDGYTWSPRRTVCRYFECPGSLAQMEDGTVILSYSQKNSPGGPRAMVSYDEGNTWEKRLYMLGWWNPSSGHTSTIVLPDGRLMTVGAGARHIQVVIWKPLPAQK